MLNILAEWMSRSWNLKRPIDRLTFWTLDPIIKNLRHMHKEHPQWFDVPKPKSDKGKSEVYYSSNYLLNNQRMFH